MSRRALTSSSGAGVTRWAAGRVASHRATGDLDHQSDGIVAGQGSEVFEAPTDVVAGDPRRPVGRGWRSRRRRRVAGRRGSRDGIVDARQLTALRPSTCAMPACRSARARGRARRHPARATPPRAPRPSPCRTPSSRRRPPCSVPRSSPPPEETSTIDPVPRADHRCGEVVAQRASVRHSSAAPSTARSRPVRRGMAGSWDRLRRSTSGARRRGRRWRQRSTPPRRHRRGRPRSDRTSTPVSCRIAAATWSSTVWRRARSTRLIPRSARPLANSAPEALRTARDDGPRPIALGELCRLVCTHGIPSRLTPLVTSG